jgi:7,8-dihydropterin-6-yl-methyl-4-(beta-D-ribofuranosyl)aminobenzene 5'-phosphate synthase
MRQFIIDPKYWPYWLVRAPKTIRKIKKLNIQFQKDLIVVEKENNKIFDNVKKFDFPEVDFLDLDVFLESKGKKNFFTDCGISYKLTTNKGSMLFDLGFGKEREGVIPNALKMGFNLDQVDGIVVSHNHWDHMGGMANVKNNTVVIQNELGNPKNKPCFVAEPTKGENLEIHQVTEPQELMDGICSIGPISRAMFWQGYCKEQTIVVNLKGKGLVVLTGCGHPTLQNITKLVKLVSDVPIYSVIGGLHLPIKKSRISRKGVRLQFIMGSGFVPWKRLNQKHLNDVIDIMNDNNVKHILLSSHDTCDYALDQFDKKCTGVVDVLTAGESYHV